MSKRKINEISDNDNSSKNNKLKKNKSQDITFVNNKVYIVLHRDYCLADQDDMDDKWIRKYAYYGKDVEDSSSVILGVYSNYAEAKRVFNDPDIKLENRFIEMITCEINTDNAWTSRKKRFVPLSDDSSSSDEDTDEEESD